MAELVKRQYSGFAGVDFINDPSMVSLNRSPDAKNVWRNYASTQGNCIETRPGYRKISTIGTKINGIYIYDLGPTIIAIIHSGTSLFKWNNYPSAPINAGDLEEISTTMNDFFTSFSMFSNSLYLNEGSQYLKFDGSTLSSVEDEAYIPTTSIGRSASGGGTIYEPVNLLQSKRYNKFTADGTSTEYYLDTIGLDSMPIEITLQDGTVLVENTDFTADRLLGEIIFNVAPAKSVLGEDNFTVLLSKTVVGYSDRIKKCTLSLTFDNRIFFSGNPDYPNILFHSRLNMPNYISDLDYYQDGTDKSKIKSMAVGNDTLWIFKESNQQNMTIFYHVPSIDSEYGKVYPSKQGNISTGCYSTSCNFNDDIVFMSKNGLEGISGDIANENALSHRSSLIDNKLINSSNFNLCKMTEWRGYLCILVNNRMFLADSQQRYTTQKGFEYEWYYWDNIVNATILKEYKGDLLFGCSNGNIYIFDGTNDDGQILNSHWTTPQDFYKVTNKLKIISKRGGLIKLKLIPNGKAKISISTDKIKDKFIKEIPLTGFSFVNLSFIDFSFVTGVDSIAVFKSKEKKILYAQFKIYSDELDKPFGIYFMNTEAYIGSYKKR